MDSLQGRRVLITGAGGFIGANLTRALLRQGADVHIIVRPETNLWRLDEILPHLTVHTLDIVERKMLHDTMLRVEPQHIIHLAIRRAESSAQERLDTLQTNVLGLYNLLEAAEHLDYLSFIHTGSSLEYGPRQAAHKETDRLQPDLFYGATRAASTLICQQFALAHRRPIVALRLFSVYGYWEDPRHLIPSAILKAFTGQALELTAPGLRRDLVFVEDVIDAYLLAMQAGRASGKIINIGSGEQWSNEAVVELIGSVTARQLTVRPGAYPPRASDTTHWVADIRRAERLLGWRPRHTLRAGLEKTAAWYGLHPEVCKGV
jgi:nucleoside-diphosphate-sugar epimerase